jgi:hypothetical protein
VITVIVWALLTGGITGAVWVAIALRDQKRQIAELQLKLLDRLEARVDGLDLIDQRLAEFEERLDFAERVKGTESHELLPPPER